MVASCRVLGQAGLWGAARHLRPQGWRGLGWKWTVRLGSTVCSSARQRQRIGGGNFRAPCSNFGVLIPSPDSSLLFAFASDLWNNSGSIRYQTSRPAQAEVLCTVYVPVPHATSIMRIRDRGSPVLFPLQCHPPFKGINILSIIVLLKKSAELRTYLLSPVLLYQTASENIQTVRVSSRSRVTFRFVLQVIRQAASIHQECPLFSLCSLQVFLACCHEIEGVYCQNRLSHAPTRR